MKCDGGIGGYHPLLTQHHIIRTQQAELAELRLRVPKVRGIRKALIELYGLQKQVKLGGHVGDITKVWRDHHALVMSSRSEGNALAMIEAMVCGRVPIVTNVGRVTALIDDNVSGFIAQAATVDLLDDALERAWQRRGDWRQIGAAAAACIRERHSFRPAEDFAETLVAVAGRRSVLSRAA